MLMHDLLGLSTFAQKGRNSRAGAEFSLADSLLGCVDLARKGSDGCLDSVGSTQNGRKLRLHGPEYLHPTEKQVSYL